MMKKFLTLSPFVLLGCAAYLTFSNSWIVPDINRWQAGITGENEYYPAFTICILVLPPLLVLLVLKWWLEKKPHR